MIKRIISLSRFTILIAVVFLLVAAIVLLLYGAVFAFDIIRDTIGERGVNDRAARELVVELIELVDLLLFGTVLYVIAIGTYTLFINTDIAVPAWLKVHDLDDLKDRLLGVVVVVLAVSFLGEVIAWDGTRELMGFGVAIGLVIAAVAFFLSRHAPARRAMIAPLTPTGRSSSRPSRRRTAPRGTGRRLTRRGE